MTKKIMSLLIIACVAMSMIGVAVGVSVYQKNKTNTVQIEVLNDTHNSATVKKDGEKKYRVDFSGLVPAEKKSYELNIADELYTTLKFSEVGNGLLKEAVYITVESKNENKKPYIDGVLLKTVLASGETYDFGANAGTIVVTFEFKIIEGATDDYYNRYQGATCDFRMELVCKTVEK